MSSAIACRPLRDVDIDAALSIEQAIQSHPWTRGNFADSLRAGYDGWLLCEDRQPLGFAITMLTPDGVELLNIGIAAQYQRGGLGKHLLRYLFEMARSQGAMRMFLEVRPSNTAALALYARCGFVRAGVRAGYYPARDGREDALLMTKDLCAPIP